MGKLFYFDGIEGIWLLADETAVLMNVSVAVLFAAFTFEV